MPGNNRMQTTDQAGSSKQGATFHDVTYLEKKQNYNKKKETISLHRNIQNVERRWP